MKDGRELDRDIAATHNNHAFGQRIQIKRFI